MTRIQLRLIIFAIVITFTVVSSLVKSWQGGDDEGPKTDPTIPVEVDISESGPKVTQSSPSHASKQDLAALNRGILNGPEEVAIVQHIVDYGELPDSFLTKNEARDRGWEASEGNLRKVAPGKSIGGDRFMNREGELPNAKGRTWYEADLNYHGGSRGAERLVFSSDGLIYVTRDHYRSFQQVRTER